MLDRPWYWSNLATHSLWNGLMSAFYVLGPLVAARAGGARAWGAIMVAGAIGSVVAGALSLRAARSGRW